MNIRRVRSVTRLVLRTAAVLGLLQVGPCAPETLQDLLVTELLNTASTEVFVATETILQNLFGV